VIKLRTLTLQEKPAIAKLARSRTAAAREVERALIILLASKGKLVPAIAQELEQTSSSICLGPTSQTSAPPSFRHRQVTESCIDLVDAPLRLPATTHKNKKCSHNI